MAHIDTSKGTIDWVKEINEAVDALPERRIKGWALEGEHNHNLPTNHLPEEKAKLLAKQLHRCMHCYDFAADLVGKRVAEQRDTSDGFKEVEKCKYLGVLNLYINGGYTKRVRQNIEKHLERCAVCGPLVVTIRDNEGSTEVVDVKLRSGKIEGLPQGLRLIMVIPKEMKEDLLQKAKDKELYPSFAYTAKKLTDAVKEVVSCGIVLIDLQKSGK